MLIIIKCEIIKLKHVEWLAFSPFHRVVKLKIRSRVLHLKYELLSKGAKPFKIKFLP